MNRQPERSMITPEQFHLLLPLACAWAEEQEDVILHQGVPLTISQLADARRVGVGQADQVRLQGLTGPERGF